MCTCVNMREYVSECVCVYAFIRNMLYVLVSVECAQCFIHLFDGHVISFSFISSPFSLDEDESSIISVHYVCRSGLCKCKYVCVHMGLDACSEVLVYRTQKIITTCDPERLTYR